MVDSEDFQVIAGEECITYYRKSEETQMGFCRNCGSSLFSKKLKLGKHVVRLGILDDTLSFLGVGMPVTEPSLGMMISQGKDFVYVGMRWLVVFRAAVLMGIVFSLNLIADWLRDEINPRLKAI